MFLDQLSLNSARCHRIKLDRICADTPSSSIIASTPPGKAKHGKLVEITWMYNDCLILDPSGLSPKEVHDQIMAAAAKTYNPENLSRIL